MTSTASLNVFQGKIFLSENAASAVKKTGGGEMNHSDISHSKNQCNTRKKGKLN